VKRIGIGGDTDNLPFQQGRFDFQEDGSLTYTNGLGDEFNGSWEITRKTINEQVTQSLQVTAIDFNSQQVRTEYYDDINFSGTDHFKGNIVSTTYSYVTHFRR
jgi:hypothetical protein